MEFPADTFDMVWACESGEHMPDKKKYVEEMVRVLKPGSPSVIAWCQRSAACRLSQKDLVNLDYLYEVGAPVLHIHRGIRLTGEGNDDYERCGHGRLDEADNCRLEALHMAGVWGIRYLCSHAQIFGTRLSET